MPVTAPLFIQEGQATAGVGRDFGAAFAGGFTQERERRAREEQIQPLLQNMISQHPQFKHLPENQKSVLTKSFTKALSNPETSGIASTMFGNLSGALESQSRMDAASQATQQKLQLAAQAKAEDDAEIKATREAIGQMGRALAPDLFQGAPLRQVGPFAGQTNEQAGATLDRLPASMQTKVLEQRKGGADDISQRLRELQLKSAEHSETERANKPTKDIINAGVKTQQEILKVQSDAYEAVTGGFVLPNELFNAADAAGIPRSEIETMSGTTNEKARAVARRLFETIQETSEQIAQRQTQSAVLGLDEKEAAKAKKAAGVAPAKEGGASDLKSTEDRLSKAIQSLLNQ